MPKTTADCLLDISKIYRGWEFVNLFHDTNKRIYYCRIRQRAPFGTTEVTGSGATMQIALYNANKAAEELERT